MKRLFLMVMILGFAFAGQVEASGMLMMGAGKPVVCGTCGAGTETVCESFNCDQACAGGYSSTCNNAWTVALTAGHTIDFDNAAAPAPLIAGETYSARLTSNADDDNYSSITVSFAAADNVYVFLAINFDSEGTIGQNRPTVTIRDGTNQLCSIWDASDNVFRVSNLLQTGGDGGDIPADTTLYMWLEYQKGTGITDHCHGYMATTTTKGAVDSEFTNGARATQGSLLRITVKRNMNIVVSKIRISTTSAFGDNPE
jgi:hypothetical protein